MKLEFSICKIGQHGILLTGLESELDSYLDESSTNAEYQKYKKSESVTVNILQSKTINEDVNLEDYKIIKHDDVDECEFIFNFDGLFELSHLIIPTEEWYNNINKETDLKNYTSVVIYNTEDEKFYDIKNNTQEEITIQDIINKVSIKTNTICSDIKNMFNTSYLLNCFYIINNNLLNLSIQSCKKTKDIIELTNLRDTLLMVINAIKYAVQLEQLYEAQRLLESITTCSPLCAEVYTNNKNQSNCGCNN